MPVTNAQAYSAGASMTTKTVSQDCSLIAEGAALAIISVNRLSKAFRSSQATCSIEDIVGDRQYSSESSERLQYYSFISEDL